jgi:hypothetical protein
MTKRQIKRSRKRLLSKEPSNLNFWRYTLSKQDEVQQFFLRGNASQKQQIIRVLNYLKRFEPLEFRDIRGEDWLNKFKDSF